MMVEATTSSAFCRTLFISIRHSDEVGKTQYPAGIQAVSGRNSPSHFPIARIGGGRIAGSIGPRQKCAGPGRRPLLKGREKKWRHSRRCAMFYWLPRFVLTY